MIAFIGTKKKKGRAAGKIVNAVLTNCVSFPGEPGILLTDKDSMFTCSKSSQFCNERNITLQTVIPGHQQSLGATERGRMNFKDISQQFIDKGTKRTMDNVYLQDRAAICALHFRPQVQQYGGFTPMHRVFGRAPRLPIGAACSPNF